MPELRAFAICPRCSDLYPAHRTCARCHADASPRAAPPAPQALPAPIVAARPPAAHTPLAVLCAIVVMACAGLLLLIASA